MPRQNVKTVETDDTNYLDTQRDDEAIEAEVEVADAEVADAEVAEAVLAPIEECKDPYMDDEFNDPNAVYPRIQTLRGEGQQKACWFITERNLDQAGWLHTYPKLETYYFQGGGEEQGAILYSPRMIVAAKTPPFYYDRTETEIQKRLILCGDSTKVDQKLFTDKGRFSKIQYFHIYLLDENNSPLTEMPFEYRPKGATRATFLNEWQRCCDAITRNHCREMGKPFQRKNSLYRSLCVFQPTIAKEKVETTVANVFAAKITGFAPITPQNWAFNFLGRNENADWFSGVLLPEQKIAPVIDAMYLLAGTEKLLAPGAD
jgi:hypothetical protein